MKKVNFSQKITIKQNLTKTKSNSNIEFNEVKLYSFKNYKIFNNNIQFQKKPYGLQKYSFLILLQSINVSTKNNIFIISCDILIQLFRRKQFFRLPQKICSELHRQWLINYDNRDYP